MAKSPGEKFQREMMKLGLGVSVRIDDGPAVDVTTYCASCGVVSLPHRDKSCPSCGAIYGEPSESGDG